MTSGSSAPTDSTSLTQGAALASSLEPHGSQKQTQSLMPVARGEEEERQSLSAAPPTSKIVFWGKPDLDPGIGKTPRSVHPPPGRWCHGPAQAPRAPGSA